MFVFLNKKQVKKISFYFFISLINNTIFILFNSLFFYHYFHNFMGLVLMQNILIHLNIYI